jgi:hypothetical protein
MIFDDYFDYDDFFSRQNYELGTRNLELKIV